MDWDEPKPKSNVTIAVGDVLDLLSVDELNARISALRDEISRVEREISKKQSHQSQADSVFKS